MLLGLSCAGSLLWPTGAHLALVVGLYIGGLTWFARTEARTSNRQSLTLAAGVMAAALLLALPLPTHRPPGATSPLFVPALVALAFFVGLPVMEAIQDPAPPRVQAGVKRSLMALILLDTVLALGTAGAVGLALLVLMLPSLYLNSRRWLYAT